MSFIIEKQNEFYALVRELLKNESVTPDLNIRPVHLEMRYHTRKVALATDVERVASRGVAENPSKKVYVVFNCRIEQNTRRLVSQMHDVVLIDHDDLLAMCKTVQQLDVIQNSMVY